MDKKKIIFLAVIVITLIVIVINLILVAKILPGSGIGSNSEKSKVELTVTVPNAGQKKELEKAEQKEKAEQEEKEEAEQELEKLKQMTERDRMEYYFSEFISYIKEENYSKAYELLYPEFKENYFKTVEEFRDYAKKTYPKSVAFSYNDIQREGYIYVLIIDVIDSSKKVSNSKSQRIVIQENDFNDFVLSFQVI